MKLMIKKWRKDRKITQAEMAKLLNVSRQTYINYESGSFEPSFITLVQISQILHTSIDDLLDNHPFTSADNKSTAKLVRDIEHVVGKYKN